VAGRQARHRKILAGMAHRLSEAVVVDVAESVEVAVDEQHGLVQATSIGRNASVGEVSGVVQRTQRSPRGFCPRGLLYGSPALL
jgi:hypothetical protein